MLKSLELSGFKSFAKKCDISFNTPITSIVGPNGSGKSNVAEAFRFVLGEQSMKSMRGKRTEDLIYNGGESQPRANRASAKLTFDNTRRVFNVDFDEVTIERIIHRDSLSEYYLNGTQVRLKDVTEMLASAHIGASGHHIISQGEADRILNSNPRERREMLEDALGLKIYQYKREESERKLEKTRENMKQVESLRKEIAPHLKFLKKQVEKFEKAQSLRDELRALYREYMFREKVYIEVSEEKIKDDKKKPEEELKRFERELADARSILEKSKHKDQKSDDVIRLEREMAQVRLRKDSTERDIGRIEGEVAGLERIRAREIAAMNAGDKQVLWKDVESALQEVRLFLTESDSVQDVGVLKSIFSKIKKTVSNIFDTYGKSVGEASLANIGEEIEKLKIKKTELEGLLQTFSMEEEGVRTEQRRLQKEVDEDKDASRDAEKSVFRIMAEENEIRGILNMIKVREEKLSLEKTDLKREEVEGAILIGRALYEYETNPPTTKNEAIAEDRHMQEERRKHLEKIKVRLEDSGGMSADDVMKEYIEVSERDTFLEKEMIDLNQSSTSLEMLISELEGKLDVLFSEGIEKINKQFKEFFVLMFGGGVASLFVAREKKKKRAVPDELALMDGIPEPEDDEEEGELGVEISVNLPRKKIRGLEMLSGGERALTSIALLFAISQVNPPPFIILDETDAALDEANSKKYGDMIENLAKHSQLIVITHNRETMSRAGVLYGVTMGREGYSKLLSIAFNEAVAVAK
jgi:chromosome segregation protein